MALSMDEQRMLAEIERRLAAEDPGLAAKLSSFRRPGPADRLRSPRGKIVGSLFAVAVVAVVSMMVYAMIPFRAHSPRSTTSPQASGSASVTGPAKAGPAAGTSASAPSTTTRTTASGASATDRTGTAPAGAKNAAKTGTTARTVSDKAAKTSTRAVTSAAAHAP
jgi:cytoskeletal protein RodZ